MTSQPSKAVQVKMTDGRTVQFSSRTRMKREAHCPDGRPGIRLDFANGETRSFPLNTELEAAYAIEGAQSRFGRAVANCPDTESMIRECDALQAQLMAGVWEVPAPQAPKPLSELELLIAALAELSGKPVEVIAKRVRARTPAERKAMGLDPRILPIMMRLRAAQASAEADPLADVLA